VADGGVVLDSGVDEIGATEIFVEAFDLTVAVRGTRRKPDTTRVYASHRQECLFYWAGESGLSTARSAI